MLLGIYLSSLSSSSSAAEAVIDQNRFCSLCMLYTGWAKNGTIYCTPHNFTKY